MLKFDFVVHELLIAKLEAYGLDLPSLKLICSYLFHRKQRVKIDKNYSEWVEIIFGVPQGSILGPLFFNIFLCDMFFLIKDVNIAGYADDNSPYTNGNSIDHVLEIINKASIDLFKWFEINFLKANPDKSHLLLSTSKTLSCNISGLDIKSSKSEKLLGIIIDHDLSFDEHLSLLCKKASQKLNALIRIANYMNFDQRKLLFNAFFLSQFQYCPLVWMFHSRTINNKINRLHERALRVIYTDHTSTFEELLTKDKSVTIHQRNLQYLAIEMFKSKNALSPAFMKDVFKEQKLTYSLRKVTEFKRRNVRSVYHGTESIANIAPQIWSQIPDDIKNAESLSEFKAKIKSFVFEKCPCRLCKTYIQNLGFL